jgi:hypothetical protein
MSTIKIHPDEFADVMMAYLYDMLRDEENLPNNEDFKYLVDQLDKKGIRPLLYNHYLGMNSHTRIRYKMVKKALMGDGDINSKIAITKGNTDYINEEEFDRDLCKHIFRTIKDYRFKHPSKVLTEERIDKIIDYCVTQKMKQQEEQTNG